MTSLNTSLVDQVHGFHPTLKSTVFIASHQGSCGLALCYQKLPPSIITDRYQLRSLFEETRLVDPPPDPSSSAHDLLVWGNPDLEAPVSVVDPDWHGGLLIPLTAPRNGTLTNYLVTVTVPFHLRYLAPAKPGHSASSLEEVIIEPPSLIVACDVQMTDRSATSAISAVSLPDQAPTDLLPANLSLQALPVANSPAIRLLIPVGHQADEVLVESVTAATVWVALGWICWRVVQARGKSFKEKQQ